MTMQYQFNAQDDAKWRDINPSDSPIGIPEPATQIFFREKPKFRYDITWTDKVGVSFSKAYYTWDDATGMLETLTADGKEPNLYIRKND